MVERAVSVDRVEHRQALRASDRGVVLAERGCEVDDARAVGRRHEVRDDDPFAAVVEWQIGERPLVAPSVHVGPGETSDDVVRALAEEARHGVGGEDEVSSGCGPAQADV